MWEGEGLTTYTHPAHVATLASGPGHSLAPWEQPPPPSGTLHSPQPSHETHGLCTLPQYMYIRTPLYISSSPTALSPALPPSLTGRHPQIIPHFYSNHSPLSFQPGQPQPCCPATPTVVERPAQTTLQAPTMPMPLVCMDLLRAHPPPPTSPHTTTSQTPTRMAPLCLPGTHLVTTGPPLSSHPTAP